MKLTTLILSLALISSVCQAETKSFTQDFQNMDADSDGYITKQELADFQQNSFGDQNKEIFATLDKNEDGTITKEEYIGFYKSTQIDDETVKKLEAKFTELDKDGNEELSEEEVQNFRQGNMGSDTDELFTALDSDGDQKISQKEFENFFESMGKLLSGN